MSVLRYSAVCLAVLSLLGCTDPPPPKKTVFDPLTQQLDRARDVQNTVDRNADATRRAVDSQERGDAEDRGDAPNHGDARDRADGRNHGDDRP